MWVLKVFLELCFGTVKRVGTERWATHGPGLPGAHVPLRETLKIKNFNSMCYILLQMCVQSTGVRWKKEFLTFFGKEFQEIFWGRHGPKWISVR